jgi:hypothetical protein
MLQVAKNAGSRRAKSRSKNVSFGESEIGEQTLIDFMTEAQQMATGVTPNDGEVKP